MCLWKDFLRKEIRSTLTIVNSNIKIAVTDALSTILRLLGDELEEAS